MSDFDTQTRMARLRECFPSVNQLAETLGCEAATVSRIANGKQPAEKHPDLEDKTRKLHEQIQNEHTAAKSMDATFQQSIMLIRQADTMDEVNEIVDRTEQVLDKQRDRICA